ncbi:MULTISPECIES: hypothetical protein [Acinetobacter calcoaceticus/baumannii complex]|uniref:hypothetical protein n=1 Tax=Acinetobacter calcoaceticus/baumannii complex TaxID=909768 RepID=UPI00131569E1|nr:MULTISPECIES: hypothetical protein [Acinetobacter calcoaceticus/baumannii complex]MBF8316404.1 hypothetical protein [Acinetobacter baumannii]MDC4876208.1 hypothetical protein [Acinetobacter baumannii]MDC4885530.1 hypothetical protein [Acinetobacter baumannii]MDC4925239.1 hypothetical protein [Acinetobacter baumannii]MDC4940150.1 hypothetical protein [Acinetobacter baumannii]
MPAIAFLVEVGKNVRRLRRSNTLRKITMLLYGYNFFVVDHNWDYLLPLDEFYKKLLNADFSEPNCTANEELLSATHRWFQAKKLAEKIGWEGDFTRGPYVFFLPNPEGFNIEYGFMFKQYNNGRTFIISPFELEYMDQYEDVVKNWINTDDKSEF